MDKQDRERDGEPEKMRKKLIFVGGTMGVGKTTVCRRLLNLLQPGVFLDGDWCWNMKPFVVSEENKAMVTDNISHLLRSFLCNSSLEYVIFCWVMHQQKIIDNLTASLSDLDFQFFSVSLICEPDALRKRLEKDIQSGLREEDVIARSLERIGCYDGLDSVKLDVSRISPQQGAEAIAGLVKGRE